MTQDPPDSQWADLLAQVGDALRQAGIDGDELHAAVAEGLLEALVTLDLEPELQPEVEVVDGGRSHDEPRTEGARPSLRLAEEDGLELDDDDGDPHRPLTTIRVHRVDTLRPAPTGLEMGAIVLAPSATQAVFFGPTAARYRILCNVGALTVLADGIAVGVLAAGASMDVCAASIQVVAADGVAAAGAYQPVAG
jgi:hypothetical protein